MHAENKKVAPFSAYSNKNGKNLKVLSGSHSYRSSIEDEQYPRSVRTTKRPNSTSKYSLEEAVKLNNFEVFISVFKFMIGIGILN